MVLSVVPLDRRAGTRFHSRAPRAGVATPRVENSNLVRIESSPGNKEVNNIAFRNPDGAISLVVVNTTKAAKPFAVTWKGKAFRTELGARSVSTFVWK